jgi:DNA mismatch endonuclease, patch repair protein
MRAIHGRLSTGWLPVGQPDRRMAVCRLVGAGSKGRYPSKMSSGVSWASSDRSRASMRATKSRDTRPELALRSALHAMGFRFRVSHRPLPGIRRTADVVFTRARVAVFLDGCYWHGCPAHYVPAINNAAYWHQKIAGNQQRDASTNELLTLEGWTVVRVWEHEPVDDAARRVASAVAAARMMIAHQHARSADGV